MSLVEALVNIAVGFSINVAGQILAFHVYGISLSAKESAIISIAFTGASLARSYIIRRIFESIRVGTWTTSFSFAGKRTAVFKTMQKHRKQKNQTGDYTPAGSV